MSSQTPASAERGYIAIVTALSVTVLIVAASLSVDAGGWYARAAQIQRAADAAALAGVVWMPDLPTARTVAVDTATRNGFAAGPSISVTVSAVASNSRQLWVTITDAAVSSAFSMGRRSPTITRDAIAEYVVPVPLGSPKNSFGTGDLLTGANRENFWAAANGYCAGHESGDLKLGRFESYSTGTGSSLQCNNGSGQNAEYDPGGYLYAVDLPSPQLTFTLQVYDAGFNTTGSTPDVSLVSEAQAVTTVFEVLGADNTPLDTSDNAVLATVTVSTNDLLRKNLWTTLHTWVNAAAGTYYVRVKTPVQATESRASNGFGLRAYTGVQFAPCTTIAGDPGYSAACPQIHGVGDMSIYANLGSTSGATATFYLAQIEPPHAGKTMQVSLFDAGEGAQKIEVLDPNGAPATFDWTTPCNPPNPPSGGCGGSGVTLLTVSGTGTQPYANLQGNSKYNDRRLTLDIRLPANYTTVYAGKVWWRIRYTVGTTPTDRTTWSANILGDPVHLVDD